MTDGIRAVLDQWTITGPHAGTQVKIKQDDYVVAVEEGNLVTAR